MDFLTDEGILTKSLEKKLARLTSIENETTAVNDSIEALKQKIAAVKAKRHAAQVAIEANIQAKNKILHKRKKREQQLQRELSLLLVCKNLIKFSHVIANMIYHAN